MNNLEHVMRLPFAPVEAYARQARPDLANAPTPNDPGAWNDARLAEVLGVPLRYISRWRKAGLTVHRADRLAAALNLHPALLWPRQWARYLAAAA
jgi:hypothetical protein